VADLQGALALLDVELTEARRVEAEATDALRARRDGEDAPTAEDLTAVAEEAAAAADAAEQHLAALVEQRTSLERERAEAADALQAIEVTSADQSVADEPAETTLAEEIEWYLLARLAAQRSVSIAGSVPLLLDDALSGLDDDDLVHVLGRLERMADAVQVIVISDDPRAAAWADLTGPERAAVVRPEPTSAPEGEGIASGHRR
jgi:hypothetical protein